VKKLGDNARIAILCITCLVSVAPAGAGERPADARNAAVEVCRPSLARQQCLGRPVPPRRFMAQADPNKDCILAYIDMWGAVHCWTHPTHTEERAKYCLEQELACYKRC
jgi:hypothetical protein